MTVDASERPDDQKRARRESRTRPYVIGAYVLLGSGFLLLGVSLWLAIKFQHDDKTEASVGALFGGGAIAISVMAGGWALLAAGMADLQSERADLRTQLLDKRLEILGEIGISQLKALTAIADVVASDAAPPTTEEKPPAPKPRDRLHGARIGHPAESRPESRPADLQGFCPLPCIGVGEPMVPPRPSSFAPRTGNPGLASRPAKPASGHDRSLTEHGKAVPWSRRA